MTADTAPALPRRPVARRAPRFQFARVFVALMIREMTTRYSRWSGGYAWAVLAPVAAIALMTTIFSLMFRSPSIGTSFALFYTSGFIPFLLYADVQSDVAGAVRFNRQLMQYPAVTPIDAVLARATLSALTTLLSASIILTGVLSIAETPVNFELRTCVAALGTSILLGAGIGSVNCVVVAFFPTWEQLWRLLTAPLFILSAVLYIYDEIPRPFSEILWFNPLIHIVGAMRSGIYGAYRADYVSLPYAAGIGLFFFCIGLYLLRRHRSAIVNPRF